MGWLNECEVFVNMRRVCKHCKGMERDSIKMEGTGGFLLKFGNTSVTQYH